jgi:hypothetical protein
LRFQDDSGTIHFSKVSVEVWSDLKSRAFAAEIVPQQKF